MTNLNTDYDILIDQINAIDSKTLVKKAFLPTKRIDKVNRKFNKK